MKGGDRQVSLTRNTQGGGEYDFEVFTEENPPRGGLFEVYVARHSTSNLRYDKSWFFVV